MATVKHLYTGYGDPSKNLGLNLTGDEVGNHLYQDLTDDQSVWMGCHHENGYFEWRKLAFKDDFLIRTPSATPSHTGQFALSNTGELFIAMDNPSANWELQWRSIGQLGDWYEG